MADIDVDIRDSGSDNSLSGDNSSMNDNGAQNIDVTTHSSDSSSSMSDNTMSSNMDDASPSPMPSPTQDPMLNSSNPSNMTEDRSSGMDMNEGSNDDNKDPMTDSAMHDSSSPKTSDNKVKAFKPKTGMFNFLRLVVDVLLVAAIFILLMQNKTLTTDKTNLSNQISNLTQTANKTEAEETAPAAAVAKLDPSLAGQMPVVINLTSTNLAKQTNNILTAAKAGDQLLLYLNSDQAVVYDPTTNTIVISGTANFAGTATATPATATSSTTTSKP